MIHAIETGEDEIEIWGDGKQTRSFMYIDDCVEGILRIMHSDIEEPINLGSDELTTINGLVDMVEDIAGVELKHQHNLSAPKGVNGRNSDNTLIKKYLGLGTRHPAARWHGTHVSLDSRRISQGSPRRNGADIIETRTYHNLFGVTYCASTINDVNCMMLPSVFFSVQPWHRITGPAAGSQASRWKLLSAS